MTLHATRLPTLAALLFDGPDAATFLQGQLTQDLRRVSAGEALPAALCSVQGRVLARLTLVPVPGGVLALLPAELRGLVRTHLQRYVLRAKVRLVEPEPAQWCVAAVSAGDAASLAEAAARAAVAGLAWAPLAGARACLAGPEPAVAAVLAGWAPLTQAAWDLAAIAAGDPPVLAATSEHWIPQMLNLDLLGAVSFNKGCYTGQEIVVRTQHLGRIKRRTLRYAGPAGAVPAPGTPLYRGEDKVAEVVLAAPSAVGVELLAVVNLADADSALGLAPGAAEFLPRALPYAVADAAAGG